MSVNLRRIDTSQPGAAAELTALRNKLSVDGDMVSEAGRQKTLEVFGEPLTPAQTVARICSEVREQGLSAVLDYTRKLDGKEITADTLRVSPEELAAAHAFADPKLLETIHSIRQGILSFQLAILHQDTRIDLEEGGYLRQRYLPLKRVGICVPGGAAAYPSTVLMTAVPAQAAGVEELVVVAPPTPFGSYNNDLLATCHELGIREVYRVGGAQAVAAMAYGVEGLPPVDKIVGPGNLFVALAKKHVYGTVDIDSIAGPSEVVVIADDTTPAEYVALDLIAQAEHAPGSSILLTWSEKLLDEVQDAIARQLGRLERSELASQSLAEFGALVLVRDRDEAIELANLLATEHLHIACDDAEEMVGAIRYAGAIFVGPYSPVALGDYAAGPSHVLPTGATARFASGLSSNSFLRSGSVIYFDQAGLESLAEEVLFMANLEGLTAHGAGVAIRRPPELD
ncbi:histidinol dehydrogenase [Bythopirellula polymerisocia]|uniref:Histidinol dehydrogenase n=1 Tax=Bythopirellula polymerisocia TaxID=2528003 RepID=A0A5C6CY03_9BACT|nr:histidinol dehydrogenase [Bythopirellula polymerisocia]TWU27866.1 Histidinol dehydrogenase [Bythopirellula polymerisocia]